MPKAKRLATSKLTRRTSTVAMRRLMLLYAAACVNKNFLAGLKHWRSCSDNLLKEPGNNATNLTNNRVALHILRLPLPRIHSRHRCITKLMPRQGTRWPAGFWSGTACATGSAVRTFSLPPITGAGSSEITSPGTRPTATPFLHEEERMRRTVPVVIWMRAASNLWE